MTAYDDIIDLPHHRSTRHQPMARQMRAAQFAPFAALVGYDDAVRETARQTDTPLDLDEEAISAINRRLSHLRDRLEDGELPTVTVTYFLPDARKAGGRYVTIVGTLRSIDEYEQTVELTTPDRRLRIPMEAVLGVESEELPDTVS